MRPPLGLALALLVLGGVGTAVDFTVAAFSAATGNPGNALAAAASFGLTQQQPLATGCVNDSGSGGCADGTALAGAWRPAVSPDGQHVYVASYGADAVALLTRDPATGALTSPAGSTACVSETGSGGACADGKALHAARDVVVSPDGAHVYVASFGSDAVAVLVRDGTTGALTQLAGTAGCVSETGSGGACADGRALIGATGLAVSPDGAHLYAVADQSNAVAAFARDPVTGALTQLAGTAGCVSDSGTGGACVDGVALDDSEQLSVSPDGRHVYVSANVSGGVAVFARDATTGALTQLAGTAGCVTDDGTGGACTNGTALSLVSDVAVSPDGAHVYASASFSQAVTVFARNALTGALTQLPGTAGCVSGVDAACGPARGLSGVEALALAPDGAYVYTAAATDGAAAVFARDATTGALVQVAGTAGCTSETGSGGACADGVGLASANGVAVAPDGAHIYVAAPSSNGLVLFARDEATGGLRQLNASPTCVSETGTVCRDGRALDGAEEVVVSPDGAHAYGVSSVSDAVTAFARSPTTGLLTQLAGTAGCRSLTGSGGACGTGTALDGPHGVAVSPEGTHLYVAAGGSRAVAAFARNPTSGALAPLPGTSACISEDGSGGACGDGRALTDPHTVAVSPDGNHLYVTSFTGDSMAALIRNPATGALTQAAGTAGCVSATGDGGQCTIGPAMDGATGVAVSGDGAHVYVASENSDAVTALGRNPTTGALTPQGCVSDTGAGGCTDGTALDRPVAVAVAPGGAHVYVAAASADAVAALARNATTGVLTPLPGTAACVSETGSGGACADGRALDNVSSVAVSPDGQDVYLTAYDADAVAVLAREAATGALAQPTGPHGCHSETGAGGCADGTGLDGPTHVALAPDGADAYVASVISDAIVSLGRTR